MYIPCTYTEFYLLNVDCTYYVQSKIFGYLTLYSLPIVCMYKCMYIWSKYTHSAETETKLWTKFLVTIHSKAYFENLSPPLEQASKHYLSNHLKSVARSMRCLPCGSRRG